MFSSGKKTPTSSKATSNVSNIYPDVIHASWLHVSFALGTFPSHKKKTQKRLLLLLFAARRMRSWAALMFQL